MHYFANSLEHLLAEMERIDLLIRSQVAYQRKIQTEDEQFRGLYISDQEVDKLLQEPIGMPTWLSSDPGRFADIELTLEQLKRQIDERKRESISRGIVLALDRLQQYFALTSFDMEILLICMAIELDPRYEKLYAYLQDDVTRKKPSVDLVFKLFAFSIERQAAARDRFSSESPLRRCRLIGLVEDPAQPQAPLLSRYIKLDDRIVQYLLGSVDLDERVQPYAELAEPRPMSVALMPDKSIIKGLQRLAASLPNGQGLVVHLRGPHGAGKRSMAQVLCQELKLHLLVADVDQMLRELEGRFSNAVPLFLREARLQNAAVYWTAFDALLTEPHRPALSPFLRELENSTGLMFLAGELPWTPFRQLRSLHYQSVTVPSPTSAERVATWRTALSGSLPDHDPIDIASLSAKFSFTRGQIQDAAANAKNLALWRNPESPQVTLSDLYDACRMYSNQALASLSRKITPRFKWGDIVLPADRLTQLREICNHMKYRDRVYGDWGFERKLGSGKGLAILFAGPSGTGKTMSAEIIADELALDLYKIDLSSIISKYIGETEKNLARIFSEAETSNAILFFDEAEALFGKRSEVRDSHDRYANIEVGYLLQRMEEYEGITILATNFRKNMDEAFVRRLHFTVEFPFPNEMDRHRIWQSIWPEDTPRHQQVDLAMMARRFEITGGNIRNIALAAAFLAADDSDNVEMRHILIATQREYQKMGKLMAEGEFRVGAAL
jgi:AAA+ superfamily predicted ATPase